jgi:hypothetical protein
MFSVKAVLAFMIERVTLKVIGLANIYAGMKSGAIGICPPLSDNIHCCERFESSITGIRNEVVVPARLAGESNPSKLCHRGSFDKCGAGLDLRGASGA